MNSTITINDRLEYAAESGAYATSLFVWGNTAKWLRNGGLVLTPTGERGPSKGCVKYNISWEKASMNIPDGPFVLEDMIHKLNAEQVPISTGNFLWLMAEAHNRHQTFEAEEATEKATDESGDSSAVQ